MKQSKKSTGVGARVIAFVLLAAIVLGIVVGAVALIQAAI